MTHKESMIFGPVPSRRLGFSLGVDIVPFKTCTLDCVYCQLGHTTCRTIERRKYAPVPEILSELRSALGKGGQIDWITLAGSGEPTLHSGIGGLIRGIKGLTRIPVAVLTNGTLLFDPAVREDLSAADLVVPDLDAGSAEVFERVNRPDPSLSYTTVVGGIEEFTVRFSGRVWLEVVLVRGINDSKREVRAIAAAASRIAPERIQLNTVVRPPADPGARPLNREEMAKAQALMREAVPGIPVEVVAGFEGERDDRPGGEIENTVMDYLARRPGTLEDLTRSLGLHRNEILKYLRRLIESGRVAEQRHGEERYFVAGRP